MRGKLLNKIKSFFCTNLAFKIASVFIAFALWFVVVTIDDPVDKKGFQNVKVNLVNTELLTNNNQIYEILDNTDVLKNLVFDAPKSVRDQIREGDIVAEADLQNLTAINTVEIKYSCPKYGAQVQNIEGNNNYVKLNIENKSQKWIDIEYNIVGQVAENYVIGKVNLNQNRLEIQGPESTVSRVKKATVEVNVAGISNDIHTSVSIKLRDSRGEEVTRATLTKNIDTVLVDVNVLGTKEIPVEYDSNGTPMEGYALTGVIEAPIHTVTVAGEARTLNRISKITVNGIGMDVTDAQGDVSHSIDLKDYLPEGLNFVGDASDYKTEVVVKVEPLINRRIDILANNIRVVNLPSNVKYMFRENSRASVEVRGLRANVEEESSLISSGEVDLREYMDKNGFSELVPLVPGTYQVPVKVELSNKVQLISSPSIEIVILDPNEIE